MVDYDEEFFNNYAHAREESADIEANKILSIPKVHSCVKRARLGEDRKLKERGRI